MTNNLFDREIVAITEAAVKRATDPLHARIARLEAVLEAAKETVEYLSPTEFSYMYYHNLDEAIAACDRDREDGKDGKK